MDVLGTLYENSVDSPPLRGVDSPRQRGVIRSGSKVNFTIVGGGDARSPLPSGRTKGLGMHGLKVKFFCDVRACVPKNFVGLFFSISSLHCPLRTAFSKNGPVVRVPGSEGASRVPHLEPSTARVLSSPLHERKYPEESRLYLGEEPAQPKDDLELAEKIALDPSIPHFASIASFLGNNDEAEHAKTGESS